MFVQEFSGTDYSKMRVDLAAQVRDILALQ